MDISKSLNTHSKNKVLQIRRLGQVEYKKAYTLQKELQKQRFEEVIPDTIILVEHPHVITLGTRGNKEDIVADTKTLKAYGVSVEKVDRGGQATLHSPGQLVGYFIFHLYNKKMALREFISSIEETLVDTLNMFNIDAVKGDQERGVWVKDRKIASIGISVSRSVSMHGFALNISNDLDAFSWIVPCGVPNRKMTSISEECKQRRLSTPSMVSVEKAIVTATKQICGYTRVYEL